MKIYVKWAVIAIVITIAYGGIFFGVAKILALNDNTVETSSPVSDVRDHPTPEQQAVINVDFNAEDTAVEDEVATEAALYNTMHQMANTKIIAEDGKIWGVKAMTKVRIENVQNAIKKLGIKDEKIIQIADRWSKQDFSKCVDDHNYIWSTYLNGSIGKAVKLR